MTSPTRSPLLTIAATITASIGLLAGCTGETPAPTPTATPTSPEGATPSTSATPTAVAVAEPPQWTADMDQVSADAALAVGQYYLELFPYVIETGDTAEWDRLSHPDCTFCSEVASAVAEAPTPRDAVQMDIETSSVQEIEPGAVFKATYSVLELSADGSTERVTAYAAIVNDAGRWMVRGVQFEPVA